MKNPFAKALKKHGKKEYSEDEHKEFNKPRVDGMSDDHAGFVELVFKLIDEGKIDTKNPNSFINDDVYNSLDDKIRAQTDLALPNIITMLERIMDLHSRPEDNNSYEMVNLIESLWQAKQRIEDHADVFIF